MRLPAFFFRFQTEERVLRVNETKIACEKTFNGNYFVAEGNHESSEDEKILFSVFLQSCNSCFKP